MAAFFRQSFKLGKKLCFPDLPSNWFNHSVATIENSQFPRPKCQILFPDSQVLYADGLEPKVMNDEDSSEWPYFKCSPHTDFLNANMRTIKDGCTWSYFNKFAVTNFLESQLPKTETKTEGKRVVIEEGKDFDVISLLSSCSSTGNNLVRCGNNCDRVGIESLRGKNVVVCCLSIPIFWLTEEPDDIRALPSQCCEIFGGADYEVVMVVKMKSNWQDDEDAYTHFLSGLPSSWLAIPFSDTLRRDFVWDSLIGSPKYVGEYSKCLFVDDNQKVLLHGSLRACVHYMKLRQDYSDYTNEFFIHWWKTHSELDALLESDFVYSTSPQGGKLAISELKKKLVALYLCIDGSFLRILNVVYQECKARNMELEIVLVYLPNYYGLPLHFFKETIDHVLRTMNISSWWVSPINDCVSHRLGRIFDDCTDDDQLVIFGPDNKFVDPYGKQVIVEFGFNAYPFTREHLVERELEMMRALSLESSFLVHGSQDHLIHYESDISENWFEFIKVPVSHVRGKIVLLYADHSESLDDQIYLELLSWYYHYKEARVPLDFEVVFVDLDGDDVSTETALVEKRKTIPMPWPCCPFDPQRIAFVKRAIPRTRGGVLVAFGKDGKIISLEAQKLLQYLGPDEFQSYNGLRDEIVSFIHFICDDEIKMNDIYSQ